MQNLFRSNVMISVNSELLKEYTFSHQRIWGVQVEIALEFARCMAYMHSRKPVLIHRDLKPANIMIGGSSFMLADTNLLLNSAGTVKVADFGLSKTLPKMTTSAHDNMQETGFAPDKYTLTGAVRFLHSHGFLSHHSCSAATCAKCIVIHGQYFVHGHIWPLTAPKALACEPTAIKSTQ